MFHGGEKERRWLLDLLLEMECCHGNNHSPGIAGRQPELGTLAEEAMKGHERCFCIWPLLPQFSPFNLHPPSFHINTFLSGIQVSFQIWMRNIGKSLVHNILSRFVSFNPLNKLVGHSFIHPKIMCPQNQIYTRRNQVEPEVKNTPASPPDSRDSDSTSGLGRSPGGGNGNPL